MYLEAHTADILSCSVCSFKYCKAACPVYDLVRSEGVSPSGFNHYALGILKGLVDYTASAAEPIYKCTTCGACRVDGCVTPGFGNPIDTPRIVEALRAEVVARNLSPSGVRELADRVRRTGNLYGEPAEARVSWAPANLIGRRNADVLLFVGCTAGYRHPGPAQEALRLFEAAGVRATLLGQKERCCGLVLFSTGERNLARELALQNVNMVQSFGVKEVIFSDAGCFRAFKKVYSGELQVPVPFPVWHVTEFLERLVQEGRLTFHKEVQRKVTYHDPCNLGIQAGVYDAPRNLLKRIPGLTFVEMKRARDKTRSVGVGGGFEFLFPELAKVLAVKRLEEARMTGAEVLVSACPSVEAHLQASVMDDGLLIRDLTELLVEAL